MGSTRHIHLFWLLHLVSIHLMLRTSQPGETWLGPYTPSKCAGKCNQWLSSYRYCSSVSATLDCCSGWRATCIKTAASKLLHVESCCLMQVKFNDMQAAVAAKSCGPLQSCIQWLCWLIVSGSKLSMHCQLPTRKLAHIDCASCIWSVEECQCVGSVEQCFCSVLEFSLSASSFCLCFERFSWKRYKHKNFLPDKIMLVLQKGLFFCAVPGAIWSRLQTQAFCVACREKRHLIWPIGLATKRRLKCWFKLLWLGTWKPDDRKRKRTDSVNYPGNCRGARIAAESLQGSWQKRELSYRKGMTNGWRRLVWWWAPPSEEAAQQDWACFDCCQQSSWKCPIHCTGKHIREHSNTRQLLSCQELNRR